MSNSSRNFYCFVGPELDLPVATTPHLSDDSNTILFQYNTKPCIGWKNYVQDAEGKRKKGKQGNGEKKRHVGLECRFMPSISPERIFIAYKNDIAAIKKIFLHFFTVQTIEPRWDFPRGCVIINNPRQHADLPYQKLNPKPFMTCLRHSVKDEISLLIVVRNFLEANSFAMPMLHCAIL